MAGQFPQPLVGVPGEEMSMARYESKGLRNPFDEDDLQTSSALNLLEQDVKFRVNQQKINRSDLFSMGERQLLDVIKQALGKAPSSTENLLRHRLWVEYDHCVASGMEQIRTDEILRGICSRSYFLHSLLTNCYVVAWLMLPPINYKVKQEETLHHALDTLRDILDLPHVRADGKIDTALVRTKMGIYQMMERRLMGEVVQKHLNLNIGHQPHEALNIDQTVKVVQEMSEECLIAEIEAMKGKRAIQERKRAFDRVAASDILLSTGTKAHESEE